VLAARFLLSIFFKYFIYLFRLGRRLILKERDITGMIYRLAYLCIFIYRYVEACIRSAALIRFSLAPYFPLAKISADPQNRILSLFTYIYYVFIIVDIVSRELQMPFP
jgi:hypothetical protein